MGGTAWTPAASHLFDVEENLTKLLSEDMAEIFHSITMQLTYLAQRGRPDIRTAVAFLSTRVLAPDMHYYWKLACVIKYIWGSADLILQLQANQPTVLNWWVDASYAVHPNMRGHSGVTMSMGQGSILSMSTKQKLVARSSTESELIGVYDALPQFLWTKNVMEAQGLTIHDVILHQDNKSAMLLENNGHASSSKRTKHIHIHYFFIKDPIDTHVLRVEYCPTEQMMADFFTKPLQGHLFYHLRDSIMNIVSHSDHHSSRRSVLRDHDDELGVDTGTGDAPNVVTEHENSRASRSKNNTATTQEDRSLFGK